MGEEGMENIPLLPRGFLSFFCDDANLVIFFPKNNSIGQIFIIEIKFPIFLQFFPFLFNKSQNLSQKNLITPSFGCFLN
jgi:hypothetical protein